MAVNGTIAMSGVEDKSEIRRRFVAVQAAKAGVGACLALCYAALVGRPDIAEAIAMVGLVMPGALALAAFTALPLATLETASFVTFAALIAYIAALTGGMQSPLVIWFALLPAEAALAGGRAAIWRATAATVVALLVVALLEALHALPPSRLVLPVWELYAGSALGSRLSGRRAGDRRAKSPARRRQGRGRGGRDVSLPRRQCDGHDHAPRHRRPHPFRQSRGAGDARPRTRKPDRHGARGARSSRRSGDDPGGVRGGELFRPLGDRRNTREAR